MTKILKSKYTQYAGYSMLLSGVGIFLLIGFFRPGTFRKQTNLGHRLGGDVFSDNAENSLGVFRKSIRTIETQPQYLYSECDLRETADHKIVVFHDWDLSRLIPDSPENRAAIKTDRIGPQRICELSLAQIKSLHLNDGQSIPTLDEVLATAVELGLRKPLILEVKYLHSDRGRQTVIDLAKRYRAQSSFEINFSAFRRNFSRSFPESREWLDKFQQSNFRVYQVYRPIHQEYDLCKTW